MSDGLLYNDIREPIMVADGSAITLATTNKALITAGQLPALGANYFGRVGKKVRIRAFGKITTAATPGNGQFAFYFGTGADATGTLIASSAAQALVASQTNISWMFDVVVTCRAVGASGTLLITGFALIGEGASVAHILIPGSAAAAVTADLTAAASIISPQFNRSGSTVETMTMQDHEFIALN